MTTYTVSTDFAAKDSLASGNPSKIVKGTEIATEFNNIASAIATKVNTSDVIPVTQGGTGATTASGARSNLSVPATDGTNATGTWPISVSGNAATATSATSATTATTATKLSTTSGTAPVYGIRAFGYVTNNGTASLVSGGNVASVTRNAAGDLSVTFSTAMPNNNYTVAISAESPDLPTGSRTAFVKKGSKLTTGFSLMTVYDGAPTTGQDCDFDFIVVG